MRSGFLLRFLLGAAVLLAPRAWAAETVFDKAAASTRAQYVSNAAKCRHRPAAERASCMKLARAGAHAALNRTYGDAVASANAVYERTTARCKAMQTAERRRCLRNARATRSIALGKAEEIRSAPLAMGMNS